MRSGRYSYIVVGGGAAGCVLAGRLAEHGARVLLLEAGPTDRSPLLSIPGASAINAANPRLNWSYQSEPQPELCGRSLYLSQGRVLGGGSSINGMVYTRGFPQDYDAWRDAGCAGWGYQDVAPYFRRSEATLGLTRGRSSLAICERILEATAQAGYPRAEDLAGSDADGFGYYDFTISRGRRASASAAFLRPRRGAPAVAVLSNAHVAKIVIEGGRATGVVFVRNGRTETVFAEHEVVLCAGAINSPKLLMLSGIGAADPLRALGLEVAADLPQVGENYQNHLSYKLAYACKTPITAYRYLNPWTGALEVLRYVTDRSGFLSEGSSPMGGFFRSDDRLAQPDLQLFAPLAVVGLIGEGLRALLPSEHGFTMFLNQGQPLSRGSVTLRAADFTVPPVVDPRYLSEPADLDALAQGARRLRELARQPALAEVISREIRPGPDVASLDEVKADIRRNAGNHFHVAGTCRMGVDPACSVVDLQLRVHGVSGLRVADCSIMPGLTNGNTNAPAMMIAEKAAAMILGET